MARGGFFARGAAWGGLGRSGALPGEGVGATASSDLEGSLPPLERGVTRPKIRERMPTIFTPIGPHSITFISPARRGKSFTHAHLQVYIMSVIRRQPEAATVVEGADYLRVFGFFRVFFWLWGGGRRSQLIALQLAQERGGFGPTDVQVQPQRLHQHSHAWTWTDLGFSTGGILVSSRLTGHQKLQPGPRQPLQNAP